MTPLALHPHNPHYFHFRDRPTVLISSTEHYGALLNLDFDFVPYLDTLHADGLNLTRVFTGAYMETPGNFDIADNTMAPKPNRLLCPWARSSLPGYANGGNKFDLAVWDPAYFRRLKDLVREASDRDIVVELTLFCPFYDDSMWAISPMNAKNNVNGVGEVPREEVYTLKHADLTALHERLTRKLVTELREADNLYYEICNEPYFGGVTAEWQAHIADTLVQAEAAFPAKHLIAQNINNGSQKIEKPNPYVSLFNFHYAHPPITVAENYLLNKAIGDDETGFRGTADVLYRSEAWDFMIAGGALYDNLDYSFTVKHPKGDFQYPAKQPGGGGVTLRKQLGILKRFMDGLEFVKMTPRNDAILGGVPDGATARVLAEAGKTYAGYLLDGTQAALRLDLPAGTWRVTWLNTKTGATDHAEEIKHAGGEAALASPAYTEDIAFLVKRR